MRKIYTVDPKARTDPPSQCRLAKQILLRTLYLRDLIFNKKK